MSGTLFKAIRDLFPSRARRRALWLLIAFSALTTVAELAAARFFGGLLGGIDGSDPSQSLLLLALFLVSFATIKGAGYLQSLFKLRVFDRSLSETQLASAAARTWQWPMAMELVSLLTQLSRLLMVTLVLAWVSPIFALLSGVCAIISMFIIGRGGRTQYDIQLGFIHAKLAGGAPTASEKISARILGAERAGLLALGPVILMVGVLGYGALAGFIAVEQALVLFIAVRIMANMYGTMAGSVMRFIRAQVYVIADAPTPPSATGAAVEDAAGSVEFGELQDALKSPEYEGLHAAQAHMRLLDDGQYFGPIAMVRSAMEIDSDGDGAKRPKGPWPPRRRCTATGPNQAWRLIVATVGIGGQTAFAMVLVDVFSRAIVGTDCVSTLDDEAVRSHVSSTVDRHDLVDDVAIYSDSLGGLKPPALTEALKDLGLFSSLTTNRPPVGRYAERPGSASQLRSMSEVREWLVALERWNNCEHYNSAIGWFRPIDVHSGAAHDVAGNRLRVLADTYETHPSLFADTIPTVEMPPVEAWIEVPQMVTDKAPREQLVATPEASLDEEVDDF